MALEGETLAVMISEFPIVISREVLSRVIPVTLIGFAATETMQEAENELLVMTVILACPGMMAVTFPFWSTVATSTLLELQVRVLSVASDGSMVADRVAVSPSTSSIEVLSRVTPVALITFLLTVTSQEAVWLPSFVVTVTVALPAFIAETLTVGALPVWSMEAMPASEVLQDTLLSEAFSGSMVAVRVALSPSVRVRVDLSSVTPLTG